jgi:glycosyltransferase involved in cell wall biosynthesis
MKVCLVTPLFEPWLIGGAERYTATLANKLSGKFEVIVVTTVGPSLRMPINKSTNPQIIEIKIKNLYSVYDYVTKFSSAGIAKKILWHTIDLWNPSVYFSFKDIIRSEKPDIVHTNGVKGFSGSLFSAIKDSNVPHVLTLHDYELISPWSSLFRNGKLIDKFNAIERLYIAYMKLISSSLDAVISPSKFVLDKHLIHGFFKKSSQYVIPNGNIIRENANPKQFSRALLYMGQITENKGVHIAVKAFKELQMPDATFHIIGGGSYLSQLKRMAEDDKRIKIYGYVQDSALVNEIIERCSYSVFPSIWYENFPLVLNEVMAHGLPVIASKIGGVPEIIEHGYNGFLIQPNNVNKLRSVLEFVMMNENLITKMSSNAIESSKRFSVERNVEQILEIYRTHVRN